MRITVAGDASCPRDGSGHGHAVMRGWYAVGVLLWLRPGEAQPCPGSSWARPENMVVVVPASAPSFYTFPECNTLLDAGFDTEAIGDYDEAKHGTVQLL